MIGRKENNRRDGAGEREFDFGIFREDLVDDGLCDSVVYFAIFLKSFVWRRIGGRDEGRERGKKLFSHFTKFIVREDEGNQLLIEIFEVNVILQYVRYLLFVLLIFLC